MIAVDTNILVHAHRRDASLHAAAAAAMRELAESPASWGICFHSLVEFYGVVTRAGLWRQPSRPREALDQIAAWRESPSLRPLYDHAGVLDELDRLARTASVVGPIVHDARIAACCIAHGVREFWTVDRDFSRFPALKVRNPLSNR